MQHILSSLFFFSVVLSSLSPLHAAELVITEDTFWAGEITLASDVLILPGATLTIEPGTTVHVLPAESTKTEPQYISSYTEITVRGTLRAQGTKEMPIIFTFTDQSGEMEWAGIIVDEGLVQLSWCHISGAESGLTYIKGEAVVQDSRFEKNRYGVSVLQAKARITLQGNLFQENDYGLVLLNGAEVKHNNTQFIRNKQSDILQTEATSYQPQEKLYEVPVQEKDAPYQSESLLGVVVWKDRVTVNGVVRIPPKSRLIIMPGTIVEFTKSDSNGDGIGENGLLVMGMLVAKGTKEQPIIFRSAEKDRKIGDWDAINIYTSDGFQNILEYVQVEDSFRALHIHFSNVLISHAVLHGNYRGLQFQESLVEVRDSDIYGNKSAMRARDSEVLFVGNRVYNNYSGPNLFRITGAVKGNIFSGNYYDGLRVREGALDVEENSMLYNRYGLTVAYANFGTFSSNVLTHNHEAGLILKGTDNIKAAANFIHANGANGISLLNARAEISGNQITNNGERGIGVISFSGTIEGNNLQGNKLYAMGLDGENDIHAPGNWWGDGADIEAIVYDRNDEPQLGRIDYETPAATAIPFTWPVSEVLTDTVWLGEVHISHRVNTLVGTTLQTLPGSTIRFAPKRGMWANGNLEAVGTVKNRILFSGQRQESDSHWHQLMAEKAQASFVNCDFEYAETALHAHFVELKVENCTFNNNQSGMMLKGGPINITASSLSDNALGLVFNKAQGEMTASTVSNNEVGIMVRAQEKNGMQVNNSSIYNNSCYNLKMGDFNDGENIDVRNNWWGGANPVDTIFDDRFEPGIGRALFEPLLREGFAVKSEKLKVKS